MHITISQLEKILDIARNEGSALVTIDHRCDYHQTGLSHEEVHFHPPRDERDPWYPYSTSLSLRIAPTGQILEVTHV